MKEKKGVTPKRAFKKNAPEEKKGGRSASVRGEVEHQNQKKGGGSSAMVVRGLNELRKGRKKVSRRRGHIFRIKEKST